MLYGRERKRYWIFHDDSSFPICKMIKDSVIQYLQTSSITQCAEAKNQIMTWLEA